MTAPAGPAGQASPDEGRLGGLARAAANLPAWLGSIRVRLAVLYSVLVFGLAALLVGGIYLGLAYELDRQPVTRTVVAEVPGRPLCRSIGSVTLCTTETEQAQVEVPDVVKAFEKETNQRALQQFRRYAFASLAVLFVASLGIGWVIADRALRPLGRILKVAQEIEATDLSRRIALKGPHDELHQLADTFDNMLARLDSAWESQRHFIHEASHELRNPIAVIRTNVDVALADPAPEVDELRRTIGVVGQAAQRMGVLVDDLLTYARREAPTRARTPVELRGLVAEAAAEFTAPAEAAGVRLAVEPGPPAWTLGDGVALKQAVANLLANAVRLSPPGTVVRVGAGREGGLAWLAVQDEGPGIEPADQPKVWERFWRKSAPGVAPERARSGLGLAIVRQIARGHGGEVGLRSAPGQGATFSIWLPAFEPIPGPAHTHPPAAPGAAAAAGVQGSRG
ncbi:MAG: sensor histidine kinase [Acidimicrobiales bacterium]